MTDFELWAYIVLLVLVSISILVACWLCFWRTRIKTFLVLGAFLFLIWPAFDNFTNEMLWDSGRQAMQGDKPTTYPFSMMAHKEGGFSIGQVPIADFIFRFNALKSILHYLLWALIFAVLARSLKGLKRAKAEEGS